MNTIAYSIRSEPPYVSKLNAWAQLEPPPKHVAPTLVTLHGLCVSQHGVRPLYQHVRSYTSVINPMRHRILAPFGTWESLIDSNLLTKKSSVLCELAAVRTQSTVWCTITRAADDGKTSLFSFTNKDMTLHEYDVPGSVHSSVHEYGGGALSVLPNGDAIVAHQADGKHSVSRIPRDGSERVVLAAPSTKHRYADFGVHPNGQYAVAIEEDHETEPVSNILVCLCTEKEGRTLLEAKHDFYAYPRFSPDGSMVAYVTWDNPQMPFWSSQLWVASVEEEGGSIRLSEPVLVGANLAQQPVWAEPSVLLYTQSGPQGGTVSEARFDVRKAKLCLTSNTPVAPCSAPDVDIQPPLWTLNDSTLVFVDAQYIVYVETADAKDTLVLLDRVTKSTTRLETAYSQFSQLRMYTDQSPALVAIASSPYAPPTVIAIQLDQVLPVLDAHTIQVPTRILQKTEAAEAVPEAYVSVPESITFPTRLPNGQPSTAHALFYPPTNPEFQAPAGTLPPCRMVAHGGPTSCASASLNLSVLYWTSRGWAVCAVNYGGSSGYGYEYRCRLNLHWGDMDVRDCVAAAAHLGGFSMPWEGSSQPSDKSSGLNGLVLTENRSADGAQTMFLSRPSLSLALEGGAALVFGAVIYVAARLSSLDWMAPVLALSISAMCLFVRIHTYVYAGMFPHSRRIHPCHP